MAAEHEYSKDDMEAARKLFAGSCDFMLGVADLAQLPDTQVPEIAFAGRSNVGKSSLINALTNRKDLARTSNTPGRTQQLNFFNLGNVMRIVDMPGYGYAKVSKKERAGWEKLIFSYLRGRTNLRCCLLLIDARHGLMESDEETMTLLDKAAMPYRIIMTKADKKAKDIQIGVKEALKKHPAAYPDVHMTSTVKMLGIEELRAMMLKITG